MFSILQRIRSNSLDKQSSQRSHKKRNTNSHISAERLYSVGALTNTEYRNIIDSDITDQNTEMEEFYQITQYCSCMKLPKVIRKSVIREPYQIEMSMSVETTTSTINNKDNNNNKDIKDNKDNNKDQDNTTKKVMKKTNKSIKNEMDVDPITLSPYEKVTYEYTTPNGCQIKYNITSIIGHIYKTGELKDPVTRNPLTDEDLTDIDNISKTYSESKLPSVLKVKENREYYNKIKQENGTIAGLEACLGEMVAELLTAIETVRPNNNYYYNKSEMEIYLIFSSFDIPFSELKRLNIENAYHCYKHWMSYLKGPPKKPTVNNMGILDVTLHLLKTHWSSEDEEALKKYRQNNSTT